MNSTCVNTVDKQAKFDDHKCNGLCCIKAKSKIVASNLTLS